MTDNFQNTQYDQFQSTDDDQWVDAEGGSGSGYSQVGPLTIQASVNGAVISGYELGDVNQRQTLGITLSWLDLNGNEVTANGWYLVRDLESGETIRAKESLYQQTQISLFLYAHENDLEVSTKAVERRGIIVALSYGAGEWATARFEYNLVNLGITAEDLL